MKERRPDLQVYVLYRDVRAYGFNEEHYRRARELGVAFVPYDPEARPRVVADGEGLLITVEERVLGRTLALPADAVVLSTAIVPDPSAEELARWRRCRTAVDRPRDEETTV